MGTRHLIGVVSGGDFKVAQYGQWDGYPNGQGVDVLAFLRNPDKVAQLRAELESIRFTTSKDRHRIEEFMRSIGCESGWMSMEQSKLYEAQFPALSRDVGAKILNMVAEGGVEFLSDDRDFGRDSLFCEWAYVVDLDHDELEVYQGFQTDTPLHGRWAGLRSSDNEKYGAVELVKSYSFAELPSDAQFCTELDPEDDDE